MTSCSEKPPSLGIYCHVPFCATTCDFCAFYQEKPRRGDIERYLAGIAAELQLTPPARTPETMFWGGGTPGLLPAEDLEFLGNCFLDTFNLGEATASGGARILRAVAGILPATRTPINFNAPGKDAVRCTQDACSPPRQFLARRKHPGMDG